MDTKEIIDITSDSDDDMIQCAQKCMICGRYLLLGQLIIKDPHYKNCQSHTECVKEYYTQRTRSIEKRKQTKKNK